jgi:DNA-binding HxlR family transcriptional regulator
MSYYLGLAANTVNGSRNGARSGAQTLCLLAAPLTALVLRALRDGPKQQSELRREAGSPAQTTLRAQFKRLVEIGALEKHRRNRFPGVLEYELTETGRELLFVADVLERWLQLAPDGPLPLGSGPAKAAVKALAEGWSTTILRVLGAVPQSLTELDGAIADLNYPTLERRLAALRLTSLVKAQPGNGAGTPYAVTDWLRRGIGPIAAAARWERRHLPQAAPPIAQLDAEAAFLLAVPLLRPPKGVLGSCRLAAEIPNGRKRNFAGVVVEVLSDGRTEPRGTQLDRYSDAWALGSSSAWLNAIIEHEVDRLELGGDSRLARILVEGLHDALFRPTDGHRP